MSEREIASTLLNPKVWESPKGSKVTVYEDGYIELDPILTHSQKANIEKAFMLAYEHLVETKKDLHPNDVFKALGWQHVR